MFTAVELFAGVGGFRLGFEAVNEMSEENKFSVIWSNQWEPTTKTQHASDIYVKRWNLEPIGEEVEKVMKSKMINGENVSKEVELVYKSYSNGDSDVHMNKDISKIDADEIPDHDILVGGFPCQDYSVAKSSSKSKGIEGKKGVLWWEIHRIAEAKKPKILFLENVDRLLRSPKLQRGRDFAIMLASLDDLGYVVEWREINAANYGMPQKRNRVFILAYRKDTELATNLVESSPLKYLRSDGIIARAFPIQYPMKLSCPNFKLKKSESDDLSDVSEDFNFADGKETPSPFENCGIMKNGVCYTFKSKPKYKGNRVALGDVLLNPENIDDEFILDAGDVVKTKGWIYQKGAKSEERKGEDGFTYHYTEGKMTFPDDLTSPSRTIITGEGGAGASRFKHVVVFQPTPDQIKRKKLNSAKSKQARKELNLDETEWLRRLSPIELERLNMFPDNHTQGVSNSKRAFLMGNALVTGIIIDIASNLLDD